jgi:hypothetical protein
MTTGQIDLVIKTVFVFRNGNVAVCDQHGQQMPEFQGRWSDKEGVIRAAAGPDVEWNVASTGAKESP